MLSSMVSLKGVVTSCSNVTLCESLMPLTDSSVIYCVLDKIVMVRTKL